MNLETLSKQLSVSKAELGPLAVLSDEQLETLSSQLLNAKASQHKHVSDAFRQAVDQLPRLLRKPILKMFEGAL